MADSVAAREEQDPNSSFHSRSVSLSHEQPASEHCAVCRSPTLTRMCAMQGLLHRHLPGELRGARAAFILAECVVV
eukprot:scaffold1466_cov385-Prasinococcus_capsulatus_cf.AAC.3